MPKRRQDATIFEDEPGPEAKPAERITVPLTGEGAIDFEKMRPATREKFAAAQAAGTKKDAPPEAAKVDQKFPREMVPGIYESLCMSVRTVGKIFFKWPDDFAALIKFSEEEKQNLTEPTGLMVDKYLAIASKWAVEINFFNALAANTAQMSQRAVKQWVQMRGAVVDGVEATPKSEQPVNGAEVSNAATAG